MTFNWYSAPTFAAMLLFWLLATYVLTRSSRSPISLAAVVAQVGTAAYLLGHGMQVNASTADEWWPWARSMQWGAAIAPAAWYWLTLLLLREQGAAATRRHLRWLGYPLGLLLAAAGLVFTAAIYVGDWLWVWSTPTSFPTRTAPYVRYYAPDGPLYPLFVLFVVGAHLGAAVNLWRGWRTAPPAGRGRFAWLLLSALLFVPEVAGFALWHWLSAEYWPTWLNHLALAGAMAVMAANVAAYDRLRHGQMIRTDLLYFLTAWALGAVAYVGVSLVVGRGYSFGWLGLVVATLSLLVLSHGLVDVARPAFDRLFLGQEVERVRSNLSSVVQSAAMTPDLGMLLDQARAEIAEASSEHLVRLTEEGLRRLNKPAALAECGLIARIPRTIAAHADRDGTRPAEATPLEQARALRGVLVLAIERLKPPERDTAPGSPAALQYHILREEYVQELPNKHIMTRHSISEGTFHRNRRSAISLLARELGKQEDLLAGERR